MLYAIGILMFSSIVLILFDRHSRYSVFFIMMAVGCIFSLLSLVFHISVFGNYYFYTSNPLYAFDYRLYTLLIKRFRFPLATVLRFLNIGHFLYQFSNGLFALEVYSCRQWQRPRRRAGEMLHRLVFIVPVITLIFCDPLVSNRLYIFCHLHLGEYALLNALTILYKALSFLIILLPVFDLIAYARIIHIPALRQRIVALTVVLTALQTGYSLLFYVGAYSISAEKVFRSGYWIFENNPVNPQRIYTLLPILTLVLMVGCLAILLSFRLDLSMRPFLGRKVQKNLKLMNETLGDVLHSHKNLLFTLKINLQKAKQRKESQSIPEIERIDRLVGGALNDTAHMLDSISAQPYAFHLYDLSKIILKAVDGTWTDDNTEIRLDESVYQSRMGYYDHYHLEQALINILNNAVEAVMKTDKKTHVIHVRTAFFFRWVVILISDNGVGISPLERSKLFLPHYSSKNGRLNWGLGLAYVYKVVKAHLGQLKIVSREGEYTSVMLMLPSVRKEREE